MKKNIAICAAAIIMAGSLWACGSGAAQATPEVSQATPEVGEAQATPEVSQAVKLPQRSDFCRRKEI